MSVRFLFASIIRKVLFNPGYSVRLPSSAENSAYEGLLALSLSEFLARLQ